MYEYPLKLFRPFGHNPEISFHFAGHCKHLLCILGKI